MPLWFSFIDDSLHFLSSDCPILSALKLPEIYHCHEKITDNDKLKDKSQSGEFRRESTRYRLPYDTGESKDCAQTNNQAPHSKS